MTSRYACAQHVCMIEVTRWEKHFAAAVMRLEEVMRLVITYHLSTPSRLVGTNLISLHGVADEADRHPFTLGLLHWMRSSSPIPGFL